MSRMILQTSSADVKSYEGLDPIESEMRRRIYWVGRF